MGCSVGFGLGFSRSDMAHLLLEPVALDVEGADHKRARTDTDPFRSQWCHTERSKDVNLGYPIAANRIMLNPRNRLKESANSRYWLTCRAISSAGEHSLHTGGVAGSIPASPTNNVKDLAHTRSGQMGSLSHPCHNGDVSDGVHSQTWFEMAGTSEALGMPAPRPLIRHQRRWHQVEP